LAFVLIPFFPEYPLKIQRITQRIFYTIVIEILGGSKAWPERSHLQAQSSLNPLKFFNDDCITFFISQAAYEKQMSLLFDRIRLFAPCVHSIQLILHIMLFPFNTLINFPPRSRNHGGAGRTPHESPKILRNLFCLLVEDNWMDRNRNNILLTRNPDKRPLIQCADQRAPILSCGLIKLYSCFSHLISPTQRVR